MMQAKLINDITDLSWLSRAFDSDIKKEVFNEVSKDWVTMEVIEEKYGEEGVNALKFFEKVRMVETRWTMSENGKAKKEYHAFYSAFHINVMTSIDMIRDVFSIVLMDDKTFSEVEDKIYEFVGEDGELSREVEKEFNFTPVQMRCIVKRSSKLEYKGMKIERYQQN
ncbi:MAG: ArsR family transcriptional regulator [Thermoplasmata archaeon]|nr:ArsR family transcriptional regulator [Thermoplasmata archaeon]